MRKIFLVRGIFFLFLVIGLQFPCVAEESQKSKEVSSPNQSQSEQPLLNKEKAHQGPVSEEAEAEASAKLVTAIEVKGNKSISTNTVISKMKTRVGNPYQENVISDDLKRLYLLGFFSDIKIDSEDYKGGIKVIITVTERPMIEKITFSGIIRITMKDEKLKELLKSKENQYLDYPNLAEDVKILKKLYEKVGYAQADVNYQVDIDKDTNKAKVQFNVVENKKVTIKNIFVKGNQAFSTGRILRLIKTKRGWLFNRGILKEEVLKEDIERIKSFYRRNGYADVTCDYEIKADAKRPYLMYINIFIKEGKKYLVGNVNIEGNKDIPLKEILAKLKECTPGKVYSEENLKGDIANIQSLYFDRGYISCQVQETTYLNPQTQRIDINYRITENDIVYVDKIKIRGNVKTRDVVVRRELRIFPGDKFDGEKLRRTKERLQNLGFFEEVSYDTEDTQDPDKKNLIVEVKESKTGAFSFGGGYSSVDQFVGFAEIEQKNFDWKNFPYFTGAGQDLKFRGSFGTLSSGFDLGFTNPWIFDYPVSFGFDAYRRIHERESDVGYGYDEKISGGDLRIGKEISEYFRTDLAYRFDNIKIGSVTEDASDDLKKEVGTNKISSLIPSITFDSRDNIFDTTKGNLLSCSLEWAGGPFGADKDFWKYYGRASHYFPLFRRSTLETRLRVGLADYYGDSDRIPIYERFFVGGADTVRGYHERKLGPIDPVSKDPLGGNAFLIGNLEYTYPVFNFLKVAAFYDVGNAWAKIRNLGSGGFKSSLGLGVRIKSPIGPIMLDYGIPLNKEPGEDNRGSGRFHFSASHGF
jgi:outer membrane protein insertion porin family